MCPEINSFNLSSTLRIAHLVAYFIVKDNFVSPFSVVALVNSGELEEEDDIDIIGFFCI